MITFNTLNTLIDDILLEYRNSNISESESLNRAQIEQWIIQYRAILIKQDVDKGRDISLDYVQTMDTIHISNVDYNYSSNIFLETGKWIAETDVDIPKTIDFHFRSGILSVSDLLGNQIQLSTEARANSQKNRRYTKDNYVAYKKYNRIRVEGPGEIEYIKIDGIFENPSELIINPTGDTRYPIPANMIPVIRDMIFAKELHRGIVDNINNSKDDTENIGISKK